MSKHVAVLMGGWSAEREVSLRSGAACARALRDEGYRVTEIDVGRDVAGRLADVKPDVAFNALHGKVGEDGTIQGILEVLRIPYTHSGVLASALAMDKDKARAVYAQAGIPIARGGAYDVEELARDHIMKPPYVIKPIAEGSSFGVFIVREGANRPPKELTDGSWTYGARALAEEFIPGRELTVGVMGATKLAREVTQRNDLLRACLQVLQLDLPIGQLVADDDRKVGAVPLRRLELTAQLAR